MPSIEDAERALRTARLNLADGDLRAAGNRAYYAIFYAANALLAGLTPVDASSIKTHEGLRRMFNLHLVRTGVFPKDVASYYTDIQQTRWAADYTDSVPAPYDIEEALTEAEAFVAACTSLLLPDAP